MMADGKSLTFEIVFFISHLPTPKIHPLCGASLLLYGRVSQGVGTTKFKNLIGLNPYWPPYRFSNLNRHLNRLHLRWESYKQKYESIDLFLLKILHGRAKKLDMKKSEENEQTFANLSLAQFMETKHQLETKLQCLQGQKLKTFNTIKATETPVRMSYHSWCESREIENIPASSDLDLLVSKIFAVRK